MSNPEPLSREHMQNVVGSLTTAFLEALSGDVSARLFLRNQGIRFMIDEDAASCEIAAVKRWVQEKGGPFRGFRRE